jgi:hypothetical protein
MNLFFIHSPEKKSINEMTEPVVDLNHEQTDYTSEGSEFLDDAIRMKDQPLMFTEKNQGPVEAQLLINEAKPLK